MREFALSVSEPPYFAPPEACVRKKDASESIFYSVFLFSGTLKTPYGCRVVLLNSIPPLFGIGNSHVMWLLSSCVLGTIVAVLGIKVSPQIFRICIMNIGTATGVSIVGMRPPNDKFLLVAGPVGMGLGAIFASPLGKDTSYL